MFRGGETVLVGVSGGPDSVCLLHVLARLGADLTLAVAHVDHGLSPTSEIVAADVARWAAAEGYEVHVVRASGLEGPNLHARARAFRYSFFQTIAAEIGADLIATGHTLDDRVETLLQRLVHGAGPGTLAGLRPAGDGLVRPLLDLRRAETRAYCDECAIAYVDDPGNDDPRFERAFVRNELVTRIEERWGDGAVRAIAASAERLREDFEALESIAELVWRTSIKVEEPGYHELELQAVLGLSRALRRRLLERSIPALRDRSAGIDEVLDALDRPDRKPDASFDLAGGVVVQILADRLVVDARGAAEPEPGK